MQTATKLKTLEGFRGHACLYELKPSFENNKYIVISAVSFCPDTQTSEVMAFPSTSEGNVKDWIDLAAIRGSQDHNELLKEMGYLLLVYKAQKKV